MSTALFIVVSFYLYGACVNYRTSIVNPWKRGIEWMIASTTLIFMTALMDIWVFGWLVLPSWGIGSIITCFGK